MKIFVEPARLEQPGAWQGEIAGDKESKADIFVIGDLFIRKIIAINERSDFRLQLNPRGPGNTTQDRAWAEPAMHSAVPSQ